MARRNFQVKAAIKRATREAQADMNRLDGEVLGDVSRIYRQAADDLKGSIAGYADSDGSVRLNVLQDLLQQVNGRLEQLGQARDELLDQGLVQAAELGVTPYADNIAAEGLARVPDEAVRFVRTFVAKDGLQLSDRIWRVDNQAKRVVRESIEQAVVQGHSASQAASDLLARGEAVPGDLQSKIRAANAQSVGRKVSGALLRDDGNPRYNAMRLMRTELNRAHGEAYMAGGEEHEDFGGWRYKLSPAHPRPDICDMHATVNRYGLGPGVYPSRDRTPWPAHPNTLSYVEIVFNDEITSEDRDGKEDRIGWLKRQRQSLQEDVLGSRNKRAALEKGLLNENQIATPWQVLKKRYASDGVNVEQLVPPAAEDIAAEYDLNFGTAPAEILEHGNEAFFAAPAAVKRVIRNTRKPSRIVVQRGGLSYFQHDRIVMDRSSMRSSHGRHSQFDVFRHEYGHHVDHWAMSDGERIGPVISYHPDAGGGLRDTIERARKSLHARSAAQKSRRLALRAEMIRRMDTNLADLFGALTNNKVGWGHSTEYLARRGNRETEIFANLFDIYSRQDRSAWEFLQRELPELAQNFEGIIERVGGQ